MSEKRTVFISFLGIGNYIDCVYAEKTSGEEERRSGVVTFVQNALAKFYETEWTQAFILTTTDSHAKHWEALSESWPLEKSILERVHIPEGKNEEEIWVIFNTVYECLKENDIVYFDITHGLRSLPLLASTLLQYAKTLKRITVKKIFYGAFEAIPGFRGAKQLVVDIPNPSDRIAPIFDLSRYSNILDWSDAAYDFIDNGNSGRLSKLASDELSPMLRKAQGQNNEASQLKNLINKINSFCMNIKTLRGKALICGSEATEIIELIDNVRNSSAVFAPLKPILTELKVAIEKTSPKREDSSNMFNAVRWCIDKGLMQEGLTLLSEGIISWFTDDEADLFDKNIREFISAYLQDQARDLSAWKKPVECGIYAGKIDTHPQCSKLKALYKNIAGIRNDINHAGMNDSPMGQDKFKAKLEELFIDAKDALYAGETS